MEDATQDTLKHSPPRKMSGSQPIEKIQFYLLALGPNRMYSVVVLNLILESIRSQNITHSETVDAHRVRMHKAGWFVSLLFSHFPIPIVCLSNVHFYYHITYISETAKVR